MSRWARTTLRRRLRDALAPLGLRRRAHRLANRGRPPAVFIWVPRTGGTSVHRSLERAGCYKLKTVREVRYDFSQTGLATFGHQWFYGLVAEGVITRAYAESAWTFAFVRNPWDRAVSLHAYLRRRDLLGPRETFDEFARRLADRDFDPIGLYTARRLSWCNPQVEWLRDTEGRLRVDFVGRFESLAEDLAVVQQRLGIERSLPHLNAARRAPYREVYDDRTRELVASAYAEDIEAFGYKF